MKKPSIYARARELAATGRFRGFNEMEQVLKDEYSPDALAILRSHVAMHTELAVQCGEAVRLGVSSSTHS
jgi:hypothetical protein